jgi:hypothetical protein
VTNLESVAAAWWRGDGTEDALDEVFDILNYDRERVPQLVAALAAAAPSGGLQYIGTSIVEDLAFQVEDGELSGAEALRLVVDSGLSRSQLFSVLTGAYAVNLRALDDLRGVALSTAQASWLLNDRAPNRWANSGQTVTDGDGLKFVAGQTAWQAELARRSSAQPS